MSDNENNFETLRRLLALKRHEVPPPGYFENFSSQVIGRIRAGEAEKTPWFLRILQAFEAKPAFPVAFASGLCLLLLFGIVSVQSNPEFAASAAFPAVDSSSVVPDGTQPLAMASTNPPADLSPSLFGSQPDSSFQPPLTTP